MTWTEIPLTHATAASTQHGVTIRALGASKRFHPKVTIVFRPDLIGPEASWIKPKAFLRLLVGEGEHAGQIRIQPATSGRAFGATGGKSTKWPMLTIQGLDWIPAQNCGPEGVDHDSGIGWVEIELPAWARPASAGAAPAQVAVDTPVRTGFSMTGSVPDPVAARRRGQAPVGSARAA